MATTVATSTDVIRAAVRPTVYVRQNWQDAWTQENHLWPVFCEWAGSPKLSTARLVWHYGTGIRPGDTVFGTVTDRDLIDYWVKISIPQTTPDATEGEETAADPLLWFGRIVADTQSPAGAPKRQGFECAGIESVLDVEIRESWFAGGTYAPGTKRRVGWGLEFNPPDRAKASATRENSMGNRSDVAGPDGPYIFAGNTVADLEGGSTWSTYEICRYLLHYHQPEDSNDAVVIPLVLDPAAAVYYLPNWDKPRVPTHGRTVRQVLDAVMDRRRGFGYAVEVDASENVVIRPYNFSHQLIILPSGNAIPMNSDQIAIDPENALDVTGIEIATTAADKYDQVVAIGDRVEFVLTLEGPGFGATSTLVSAWSAALESDYETAASGEAGYAALSRAEKQQRNRDYRASDHLAAVFAHFAPEAGWPEEDDGEDWTNPIPDAVYTALGLDKAGGDRFFWRPRTQFERDLPLKTGIDYSTSTPTDSNDSGDGWEWQRPIVIFELEDDLASTASKYQLADKLSACAGIEGTGAGAGRSFSVGIRMRQYVAGFVLSVHGQPQHAIANSDFTPLPDTIDDEAALPQYDWDDMIITAAVKADYAVEERWPENINTLDPARILTIDASARAGLVHMPTNTVLGCDVDGELIRSHADNVWVRDDRDLLEDAARIAFMWYGEDRAALSLTWKQAQNADLFSVGDLITEIGPTGSAETIRTVITSIRIQFGQKPEQSHTTTIKTQWAELDVLEYV